MSTKKRPTISELETILNERELPITVLPNGELRCYSESVSLYLRWRHLVEKWIEDGWLPQLSQGQTLLDLTSDSPRRVWIIKLSMFKGSVVDGRMFTAQHEDHDTAFRQALEKAEEAL